MTITLTADFMAALTPASSAPAACASRAAEELGHALAHFAGGFVGEGDRQDVPCGNSAGRHVGDAAGDGAGFAGAGAGEDEEGSVDVGGGGTLGVGEAFKNLFGGEHFESFRARWGKTMEYSRLPGVGM